MRFSKTPITGFSSDFTPAELLLQNRDDVLTYLIHLGYLGYDEENETAFVPNEEIRQELITAVRSSNWDELIAFQQESRKLLEATKKRGVL